MSFSVPPSGSVDPSVRLNRLNRLMSAQGRPTEGVNRETIFLDQGETLDTLTLLNQQDKTVAQAVEEALPQLAPVVDAVVKAFKEGGRLFYVGAGTSGRLGVLDAVECVPTFGTPPEQVQGLIAGGEKALTQAVEGAEDDVLQGEYDLAQKGITTHDVVVGISASGGAPYVRGAVQHARRQGAVTASVVNNPKAPLNDDVDYPVVVETGPEPITGSTRMKSGTAQKMVLNMLSTAAMVRSGRTYGNVMIDVVPTNDKLVERSRRMVSGLTGVSAEKATKFLEQANGKVKEAVMMAVFRVPVEQAKAMLNETHGFIGPWLDNQESQP